MNGLCALYKPQYGCNRGLSQQAAVSTVGDAMEPPPSPVKLIVVSGLFVTCLFVGAPLLVIVSFGLLAAAQGVLVLTDVGSGWQQ